MQRFWIAWCIHAAFFKWLKDTRFGMHFCSKKCGVPTMFQPYIFRCENVSLHHFSRVFRPRTESDKWYIDLGSCSNQPVDCWIKISLSSPSWSPSNKTPHVSLYAPRFAGANVEPKLENVSLEKLRIFGPPCPPPSPKKIVPLAKHAPKTKKTTSSSVNPKNVHRGFSRIHGPLCATPKLQWPWVCL